MDDGEDRPYWEAVVFTAVASSVGLALARSDFNNKYGDSYSGMIPYKKFILYSTAFGAVATSLTYIFFPRRTEKSTSALWQYTPQVSVLPVARGGSVMLNWSF